MGAQEPGVVKGVIPGNGAHLPPGVVQLHLRHPEASFTSGKITDPQTEMSPGPCPPMGLGHMSLGKLILHCREPLDSFLSPINLQKSP